ncbi:MAG: hypothetical protein JF606_10875 [Burkholderiales bacterium]|jgi:3-oxoacyl-[acyl-carrier-protein] synthase I|nr:hypothetical protein [Burkholderiales bacterium]
MNSPQIAIRRTGLVTSVGLDAASSCAAMRAKITQPSETRFMTSDGTWIQGHAVPLEKAWRGHGKLVRMAAMAIDECLQGVARDTWPGIALLLCVAERERPGRPAGLEDRLFDDIQTALGARFSPASAVVPHGRVSAAVALASARNLLQQGVCSQVVIAAADSLLGGPSIQSFQRAGRLLTPTQSDGFMPGEAGGAVLVGLAPVAGELACSGVGFGVEAAHLESGEPLRADGLAAAIRQALADAGREMHDMDFRITDVSGEQYYFKEAALALSRTMRQRKDAFDIWHPAESIGEAGAAAGLAVLAVAHAACRKGYTLGPNILMHLANDSGQRAAAILHSVGST